jgi:hypothetical protein
MTFWLDTRLSLAIAPWISEQRISPDTEPGPGVGVHPRAGELVVEITAS